ncbi:hypothetical protein [Limnobacter parvus]|uniref:Uncharacterized protein n=1 Tax=Limnobacter parvus TaxID=2939690 RepID=A0ABT1XMC5_9BURK|nr:hypothetical protein [Limnobacter parvus]MCR2747244.1 hypothetical protein [Limnobacter parvus]
MTVNPSSALPVTLGQATQIQAPAENVAQFKSLMMSIESSLGKSQSSLDDKKSSSEWAGSSLLEDTAIRVNLAEKAVHRLEKDINSKTAEMSTANDLKGNLAQLMVEQRHAQTYYFVGLNRVGEASQNFSEELQSVTRGR